MTIMCGVRLSDRGEIITDVHFGRVPVEGETVPIFGKLYKVAGVSWPVVENTRTSQTGIVVDTVHSAVHPVIDLGLMYEEEEDE